MKFVVFYLQFINSLEGVGMFFSSAALIRRLRSYAATLPLFKKGHSMVNLFSSVFIALLLTIAARRKYNCHDVDNQMNCINS